MFFWLVQGVHSRGDSGLEMPWKVWRVQEGGRFGNLCLDSLADAYKFSSRAEDDPFLSITDGSALNLV